jgi:hypothetical protein
MASVDLLELSRTEYAGSHFAAHIFYSKAMFPLALNLQMDFAEQHPFMCTDIQKVSCG